MTRPRCVVRVDSLEAEERPSFRPDAGARARVRELRPLVGMERMGVSLREVLPGSTSTHRHWHDVEEEWAYVLEGSGAVRIGPHRLDVRAGHFVGFVPGPRPHHFVAGDTPLLLLEGGERRAGDRVAYPDLGLIRAEGDFVAFDPADEQGEVSQCVHVDDVPVRHFRHSVDARAQRTYRSLHSAVGLTRQSVRMTCVAAGALSTAFHTHDRTDEWVFLLEGRARVRVGDDVFEASAGDFIGHPAGSPAHEMEPQTDLTYLMGGMIDADDVVTYPEAGVRLRADVLEPIA